MRELGVSEDTSVGRSVGRFARESFYFCVVGCELPRKKKNSVFGEGGRPHPSHPSTHPIHPSAPSRPRRSLLVVAHSSFPRRARARVCAILPRSATSRGSLRRGRATATTAAAKDALDGRRLAGTIGGHSTRARAALGLGLGGVPRGAPAAVAGPVEERAAARTRTRTRTRAGGRGRADANADANAEGGVGVAVGVAGEAAGGGHPAAVGGVRRGVCGRAGHRAGRGRGGDGGGDGGCEEGCLVRGGRVRARLAPACAGRERRGAKVGRGDRERVPAGRAARGPGPGPSPAAAAVRRCAVQAVPKARRAAHPGRFGLDLRLVVPGRGACAGAAAVKVAEGARRALAMAPVGVVAVAVSVSMSMSVSVSMTHVSSIVTWLGVRVLRVLRVLRVKGGAGSVTHRIGHVVVSIPGRTMHICGRPRTVFVLLRAVFLTGAEARIASTSIGLGLALLARVVRAAAVDVLGKECGEVVLEALCFL
jgi:hypothetical protein